MPKRSPLATSSPYRELPVNVYGGIAARERQLQRRERLIQAGFELFSKNGFAETTIGELAARAGCALRTFYEEFGTREALLGEMYQRVMDEVMEATLGAVRSKSPDRPAMVRAGVDAYVASITADAAKTRIFVLEMSVSRDLEKERRRALREFVIQLALIVETIAPDLARDEVELMCLALTGAADRLVMEWLLSKGRLTAARVSSMLFALWARALGLPA